MRAHPPAAWLQLNGDGVLVACLELVVGISGLLTPQRLVSQYGYIPGLSYLWLAGYIVGGVLLLAGLWTRRPVVEVYSRVLLVAVNLIQLGSALAAFGPGGVARDAVISAVVIVTMVMRGTAMLRGGIYEVPRWHRKRHQ